MAECFWTDMVGCAEDCGAAPAGAAYVVVEGTNAEFFLDVFPSLDAIDADEPADATHLLLTRAVVYLPAGDEQNCTWFSKYVGLHDEAPGSDVVGSEAFGINGTMQPPSYFEAGAGTVYEGTGSLPVTTHFDSGHLTDEEVWAFAGATGSPAGVGFVFALTLVDSVTGATYTGSGRQTFCL